MTTRTRQPELASERYEIRRICTEASHRIADIMQALGAWEAGPEHRIMASQGNPIAPRVEILISNLKNRDRKHDKRKRCGVIFGEFRYGSGSDIVWGSASVSSDPTANDDMQSETLENRLDKVVPPTPVTRTITIENSISRSYAKEVSVEVTSTTSASGSYMGVEVSQEIALKTGFTASETEGMEASRSNEKVVAATIPELDPHEAIIMSVAKRRTVTVTPYTVDGHLEGYVSLNFPDWASSKYVGGKIRDASFESWRAFLQFLEGYDVRYPHMRTFIDECPAKVYRAIEWLRDPKNRTIQAVGELREVNDNDEHIVFASPD